MHAGPLRAISQWSVNKEHSRDITLFFDIWHQFLITAIVRVVMVYMYRKWASNVQGKLWKESWKRPKPRWKVLKKSWNFDTKKAYMLIPLSYKNKSKVKFLYTYKMLFSVCLILWLCFLRKKLFFLTCVKLYHAFLG